MKGIASILNIKCPALKYAVVYLNLRRSSSGVHLSKIHICQVKKLTLQATKTPVDALKSDLNMQYNSYTARCASIIAILDGQNMEQLVMKFIAVPSIENYHCILQT